MSERSWTFFTNHAAVLIHLLEKPDSTIRSIADELGLAERTVVGALHDLRTDGYLIMHKEGRQNVYNVNPDGVMRRPEHAGYTIAEFFRHAQKALEHERRAAKTRKLKDRKQAKS